MRTRGLTPTRVQIHPPTDEWQRKQGWTYQACRQVLQTPDQPTAYLCNMDGQLMFHAAASLGIRIPEQLSLFTFDNIAPSDEAVAIDRLVVPFRNLGQATISELLALINDPHTPRKPVVLPFEFQRKGTVARPHRVIP
jgi:DNA-binding LacI/PurR family transcriptional regulator